MRKIELSQILIFVAFFTLALLFGVGTTKLLFGVPLGDFRGLALFLSAILLSYSYALLIYRVFLAWCLLMPGEIAEGSKQESIYHVYLLFYLVLFYPVMRSGFMPVPIKYDSRTVGVWSQPRA